MTMVHDNGIGVIGQQWRQGVRVASIGARTGCINNIGFGRRIR